MMTVTVDQVGGLIVDESGEEMVQCTIQIARSKLDADAAGYDPAVPTSVSPTAARDGYLPILAAYIAHEGGG